MRHPMKLRPSWLAAVLGVLLLAGCSSFTDLRDFEIVPGEPREVMAEGGPGLIFVEGTMTTPTPCYEVAAEVRRSGSSVGLRLVATDPGVACIQVIAHQSYEARIDGLRPGEYDLVVLHTYPGIGWEEERFELRVSVAP